eukprot:TRINITY_DN4646_c0_g1_i2.p2 TRINITY_DN4646_c0_g1~~TRINITY_DN4646_c0_g1_i2.p2  ORF type:complete len:164 (-),score=44.82 TRINITY_DN4646_c0_g1_i2:312-803(-)
MSEDALDGMVESNRVVLRMARHHPHAFAAYVKVLPWVVRLAGADAFVKSMLADSPRDLAMVANDTEWRRRFGCAVLEHFSRGGADFCAEVAMLYEPPTQARVLPEPRVPVDVWVGSDDVLTPPRMCARLCDDLNTGSDAGAGACVVHLVPGEGHSVEWRAKAF